MKYRQRREEANESIDISPLIDMVFILLIFFMVSTTFVQDMDLDINRPEAESAEESSNETTRIYVDTEGAVYFDGDPVRMWALQGRVRDALAGSSDDTILVVTDDDVPSGRLVEVVDQARLAGASDVGVATKDEAGGRQ
ncbi:ExbD/TolR family protein [Thiohalospira sp.]|uniref:ExbD/TolR family protein n=1 Tax=Thiohalospira sp. TaxID=3080549 RepID=UPI003980B658